MKILKEFARFFVGGLFIFSGLIKVNDPIGTAIKLEEYFEVFAYDFAPFFEWFVPAATFLSVFLSVLEVILGIALLIGFRIKEASWVLLSIIVFFTFLTFYSAYFNKVTDCGCFGDAIKLTPWQSFYKDLILLIFIGLIFLFRSEYKNFFVAKTGNIIMSVALVSNIFLAIYAILHLPFIDFRSYAIGNSIPELMQPSGELIYEYMMEKDGKEFRFDQYPSDNTYTFKSMDILNPEVQPKISDLAVWNDEGDFTEELLTGNKLVIITHAISKTSSKNSEKIKSILENTKNADKWVLTSSNREEYEEFQKMVGWDAPYFYTDATVLKTMVRSTPGIILLQNGVVRGKWHYNDVPNVDVINKILN